MPRKAKTITQSIFEVVGGSYAPAPVNFSSQYQHSQHNQHNQHNQQYNNQPQQYSAHNHNPAAAGFINPLVIPIDPLTSFVTLVNSNPYVIGLLYLFLNLSGRFLSMELTKQQEQFLSQPYLRPFILFTVMFVATRNIAIAFWSTIAILSIIWVFANENHILCLIPGWRQTTTGNDSDKSYEDNMKAIREKHKHEEPPHVEHHVEHNVEQNVESPPKPAE